MMDKKEETQDVKDIHIQLLKESLWDVRDQRNFFKKLMLVLCLIIVLQIIAITILGLFDRKLLREYPAAAQHTENVRSNKS